MTTTTTKQLFNAILALCAAMTSCKILEIYQASVHYLKGHITHKTSICWGFFVFCLFCFFLTYFGSLHKNHSTRLPKKIIAVKFKPIYCYNVGQKI